MRSIFILLCLLSLIVGIVSGDNQTALNISHINQTTTVSGVYADTSERPYNTDTDKQFLFLMNQYWIPDFYDIKGRVDGAAGFGSDVPQMLNLSLDYARIRLNKNINETNGYSISPQVSNLRIHYQTGVLQSIRIIDEIMALNRTDESFVQNVSSRTASFSLYGTWLEYQVMRCYDLPNMSYPEIASVPPEKFMQVMGIISP